MVEGAGTSTASSAANFDIFTLFFSFSFMFCFMLGVYEFHDKLVLYWRG